jgi:GNAT superfamily N-acetyltransferase
MARQALSFHALVPARFADLERLFGPRGACGGCWCMFMRIRRPQFERDKGEGNRRALEGLVRTGQPTGILAYLGQEPVGWCAIAPRESTPRLDQSRLFKPVDARPVWSLTCLFVARNRRRTGLSVRLLRAACEHARSHGARCVEGYPTEPSGAQADAFVWQGLVAAFVKAGFREVARRAPTRPIMRRELRPRAGSTKSSTHLTNLLVSR